MAGAKEAKIRFFCQADAPGFAATNSVTDASFDYLVAIRQVGAVRAIAAGLVDFGTHRQFKRGAKWFRAPNRWHTVADLFAIPMATAGYVNIVCGRGLDFSRYYTVGVTNIAISPAGNAPDAKETSALALYNEVICPLDDRARELRVLGVAAIHMLPEPGQLARLLAAYPTQ